MKCSRQDRNKDFDTFYDESKDVFRSLQRSGRRAGKLKESICYVCVPVAGTEGQISELSKYSGEVKCLKMKHKEGIEIINGARKYSFLL